MRVLTFQGTQVLQSQVLPDGCPQQGFVWISLGRAELGERLAEVQQALLRLCGVSLVDLHVSDLLNPSLPSNFDFTAQYDVLVFRRLAQNKVRGPVPTPGGGMTKPRHGPPVLRRIDTSPVGFALFDQVLLSVHPAASPVLDDYAERLLAMTGGDIRDEREPGRSGPVRVMPASPADLMLRLVGQIVDGYLDLRRDLGRQLDHWQNELLNPRSRFTHWDALLEARLSLHQLDEICEDQRVAIQDWIAALHAWSEDGGAVGVREYELLKVRSRDVLEHIERVVHHVRRLESSAESTIQIHFSAQSHRTNEIMRTLTVLTAVFLPLNLIAGIFGMNFDVIPFQHLPIGFWLTMAGMGLIALLLTLYFWRKRYLERLT